MLKIHDLSKELEMTAVRGGNAARWPSCGDEDSDDRHHGERGDRDRHRQRCERNDDASLGVGCFTNLPSCGWYDATK